MYELTTIETSVDSVLLKEKGSKFIGYAFPVDDENSMKTCLEAVKTEHPMATHHCYAFRIGLEGELHRANDDGEPAGSAGLPIYNQLLAHAVTNILLIVVRYYGGTKLGVSGLVKAYKETAKQTLEASKIIVRELETEVSATFAFSQQHLMFTLLHKAEAKILDFKSENNCHIRASVKLSQKKSISEQLSEMLHVSFSFAT